MDLQGQIAAEQAIVNCNSHKRETPWPDRFTKLVRLLNLQQRETEIRRCFHLVCGESMQPGAGWSSLNTDGTPVQLALSLIAGRPPAFEFVGEPFQCGMDYTARRSFGLESAARLAGALGVQRELQDIQSPLSALGSECPAGECEDPVGAFWVGAAFESAPPDSMTAYANVRRGPEDSRWTRLAQFAEAIAGAEWQPVFAVAKACGSKPLGAGVRIRAGAHPHARIYFSAYGVILQEYRRIFRETAAGKPFDHALAVFFETALKTGATLPTQSAVLSFGSDGHGEWSPKLELCGHCAWRTDKEATIYCGAWLERMGMDADLYCDAVAILADHRRRESVRVHAYVGIGAKRDLPYASIYLNPGRDV